jgi:dihydroorotate dehydrogenase electron transfer subunit
LASACVDVEVVSLKRLGRDTGAGGFYELEFSPPGWKNWRAGQFVMLRPERFGRDLLWGRPFSIARCDGEGLAVYFQEVGRGTAEMARMRPGEKVAAWGPLGNGFLMEEDSPTLLLAGGIGVASFVGYVERHPKPENLHMIFGHTKPYECYPCAALGERINHEAFYERGPDDLLQFIRLIDERMCVYAEHGLVLACGPTPFLKTVKEVAMRETIRVQVSLENRMACGVGACLGCVSRLEGKGPVTVCTRGPVFWADEIDLEGK